jgi:LPS-assembly protein
LPPDPALVRFRPRLLALAVCVQIGACVHQGAGMPDPVKRDTAGASGSPAAPAAPAPAETAAGDGDVTTDTTTAGGLYQGDEQPRISPAEGRRRRREAQAAASTPALPAAIDPGSGGLGLKLDPEMIDFEAPPASSELPVFLEADRIEGVQDKHVDAIGNAIVRRRGLRLSADRLSYSIPDDTVTATGQVRFRREGDLVTGDRATYNLAQDTGNMDNAGYRFSDLGSRGRANRVVMRDRDRYRAERATYTNCDVGDDDWFMRVDRLDLDRLTEQGVARNATVYFKGAPVLYTPWIDFPLSGRRKTGFLPPTIGTTDKSGFEFTLPFYWNIAPNMDYTIAPRVMAKRGVLLNNEFRYLEPGFSGVARAEFLPNDRIEDRSRWAYVLQHQQTFTPRLTGAVNVQGVSDDNYFRDLSDKVATTSQTQLPREGSVTYNGDWWTLFTRVQSYQTLQDPLAPVLEPYARLPQVALNAAQQNVKGFDLRMYGEVVNFEHPSLVSAVRQVYYPSASYRLGDGFFYVLPKAGLHYTAYTYRDGGRSGDSRTLPIFSVDSGMNFARSTTAFGNAFTQTLEPRLYYLYIPYRRQDQLPVFDTAVADFNLAEIFTENRFSGYDRINDANQITAALTTRYLDERSGAERLRATIAQRYYLKDQEVTLGRDDLRISNRSDLLAGLTGYLTHSWWLDLGMQYNVDGGATEKFNVGARYRPQPGKAFNVSYRFTRDTLEQVDVAAQWPLTQRWGVVARWNYSIPDKTVVEALGGLEYNAGCWAARFVVHDFVTSESSRSKAFFAQVELSGLSTLGISPLRTLTQGIYGYERVPQRGAAPVEYYPGMDEE